MAVEMILIKNAFNKGISYTLCDCICVFFIITLSLAYPKFIHKYKFINQQGNWPLFVYIFHPIVISIAWNIIYKYDLEVKKNTAYLAPLAVALASVLLAVFVNLVVVLISSIVRKKQNII